MKVNLISITPGAEEKIAYMARVSSNQQENSNIAGLISYCAKHGHWSIFEMANMVIEIETTRGISPQILRHRSFSFQEFSQRYASVDESGVELYVARRQDSKNRQNSVDDLEPEIQQKWLAIQQANWKRSFEDYTWALDNEIAKECARTVLPLGTKTKLYMNGSIRSWIHYIELRSANGTQKEHMDIACAIKDVFIKELPVISKALDWV